MGCLGNDRNIDETDVLKHGDDGRKLTRSTFLSVMTMVARRDGNYCVRELSIVKDDWSLLRKRPARGWRVCKH